MSTPRRTRRSTSPKYLTVQEAAHEFGLNPETLYRWCRKGVVPHVRVGPAPGVIRLRPDDLRQVVTPDDVG